ncbi:MAG: dTDP-4-dehydrorhamnose reductase [Salegentibacter sp.]|uniref:dTDP-4-dehydrorhamnose reductase n=1 Tax=Salegentibacter flavus TaxID=287099 RepID=A0A1I5A1J8_9FLAO|nr:MULTISPECIES: dTDP-4-dehydrorhamnose reductase [Salegentibacter]MDR9458083.1 dTDP-4-dehydrorhamnose reductase [Salegentibacter sp.]SFN56240.1 dTDP-4-dehydrorhamnose reductase [Salegentibacter flavus]
MKKVLVTGASGQLGRCFQKITSEYPELKFKSLDSSELDITDENLLQQIFSAEKPDYCINCAAYTNVEKAEDDKETAFKINAEGVKKLAEVCKTAGTVLIHFSTDYVFDGKASEPYQETDKVNPINVYGASKLKGEEYIRQILDKYFIFRTSWLYSEFGHNFFNTILKKAEEGASLNITTNQIGTPTNANDLANFVLQLINEENTHFGLYHYSNTGEATWFDFAKAILDLAGKSKEVDINKSGYYKTRAKRPVFSVLNKNKLQQNLRKPVLNWRDSLEDLITNRSRKFK